MSSESDQQDAARIDENLAGAPHSKSSIRELAGRLVLFTREAGERVIIKIDKERPEIPFIFKKFKAIDSEEKVLVVNGGDGSIPLTLAVKYPATQVDTQEPNHRKAEILRRNLEVNGSLAAVIQLTAEPRQESYDRVFYVVPKEHTPRSTVLEEIVTSISFLKPGGALNIFANVSQGAERIVATLQNALPQSTVEIIARKGGMRIIQVNGVIDRESLNLLIEHTTEEFSFDVKGQLFQARSRSGQFSRGELDHLSRFLLENVDFSSHEQVLDLGCGWGALGIVACGLNPTLRATLVDVERTALESATENAMLNGVSGRVRVVHLDGVGEEFDGTHDLLISNPPFHESTEIMLSTFKAMSKTLSRGATIYVSVEDTYLEKYISILEEVFGAVGVVKQDRSIQASLLSRRF